ncbi:MAG: hypothetical protein BGO76_07615 [Caedibacter sp. 38-128]|nr:HAD-IA family hydrolase [Holosporales bacterium]OJX04870.1 MAG: hypothetical protein BGO76_07615 [Caedibacter sp. 38-128]
MLNLVKSIGVPAYLGTNQDSYRTKHIKKIVGHTFRGCFASYAIGHIKPESGFYRYIENELGLESKQILLIDDTLANVEGAKARGWQSYLYKGDLKQLKTFLQELNLLT